MLMLLKEKKTKVDWAEFIKIIGDALVPDCS